MALKPERPLSPHLQVYRLPFSALTSIAHRITGAGLAVGLLMLAWLLVAAAAGEGAYNAFRDFAGSPFGLFLLFGWSVALYYHLFNGIRHLVWDTGRLFKIKDANLAGYGVLAFTALATVLTWWEVLR